MGECTVDSKDAVPIRSAIEMLLRFFGEVALLVPGWKERLRQLDDSARAASYRELRTRLQCAITEIKQTGNRPPSHNPNQQNLFENQDC